MNNFKSEARKQIIAEFQLGRQVRPHLKHKAGRSALQKIIEDIEYMDIEDVLANYQPQVLATKYHLDLSTISKWKARLGWWEVTDRKEVI